MNLISPGFVNQLRIPWRIKEQSCIVKGPFETQWVRRETEPLAIEVEGKTTNVVFDIVDMGPDKDMILGHPWHEDYNPDINWKDGGHLRPREKREYPTKLIGEVQELRQGSTLDNASPTSPPHEQGRKKQVTFDSTTSGNRQEEEKWLNQEVALISVDEQGHLEL
jgi:hypothetical protein